MSSPRRMDLVRGGLGLAHLAAPGLAGRLLSGAPFGSGARAVVRVLGARQVVQAAASWARPSTAVIALGAGVDALHSASMIALAGFSRRWRRAGLLDAAIAGALAWAGLAAARSSVTSAPDPASGPTPGAGLWVLRDRVAWALVGVLVPRCLVGSRADRVEDA
jgi:hypothetical protein